MFRSACTTADQGLAFAYGSRPRAAVTLPTGGALSVVGHAPAVIGWTTPVVTYNRMRSLQAEALQLDTKVDAYVPRTAPFYAAWKAWYRDTWTPFYQKYAGPDASDWAKGVAAFDSDELADQERTYEAQFDSLLQEYNRQPGVPKQTPARRNFVEGGSALPWWFWVGATVAAAGGGYLLYRKYQEGKRRVAFVDRHAPGIIDSVIPGGHGKAIAEWGQGRERE